MQGSVLTSGAFTRFSERSVGRTFSLGFVAAMFGFMGFMASSELVQRSLWAASLTLVFLAGLIVATAFWQRRRRNTVNGVISGFIAKDAAPSFVVNSEGKIQSKNDAAQARFGKDISDTLIATLRNCFANPTALLFRLQTRATADGSSREDLVTRTGHVRLSVHLMGHDAYLWRLEDIGDVAVQSSYGPALPMILIGRTDAVLYMNGSAKRLIGRRVKTLDQMFQALPIVDGMVCEFDGAGGPTTALVSEVDAGAGRRAIYLLPPGPQNAAAQGWNALQLASSIG